MVEILIEVGIVSLEKVEIVIEEDEMISIDLNVKEEREVDQNLVNNVFSLVLEIEMD